MRTRRHPKAPGGHREIRLAVALEVSEALQGIDAARKSKSRSGAHQIRSSCRLPASDLRPPLANELDELVVPQRLRPQRQPLLAPRRAFALGRAPESGRSPLYPERRRYA